MAVEVVHLVAGYGVVVKEGKAHGCQHDSFEARFHIFGLF